MNQKHYNELMLIAADLEAQGDGAIAKALRAALAPSDAAGAPVAYAKPFDLKVLEEQDKIGTRLYRKPQGKAVVPLYAAPVAPAAPLTEDERTAILRLCRLYLDEPEKCNAKAVFTRIFSVAATPTTVAPAAVAPSETNEPKAFVVTSTHGQVLCGQAERIINRLMSSDPQFDDCADAADLIRGLVSEYRALSLELLAALDAHAAAPTPTVAADAAAPLTQSQRNVIYDAMYNVSEHADGIKAGCAIGDDEWPDAEDKAYYDKQVSVLERLRGLLEAPEAAPKASTIAAILDALAPIAARQTNLLASVAVNDCIQAIEKIGKGE